MFKHRKKFLTSHIFRICQNPDIIDICHTLTIWNLKMKSVSSMYLNSVEVMNQIQDASSSCESNFRRYGKMSYFYSINLLMKPFSYHVTGLWSVFKPCVKFQTISDVMDRSYTLDNIDILMKPVYFLASGL